MSYNASRLSDRDLPTVSKIPFIFQLAPATIINKATRFRSESVGGKQIRLLKLNIVRTRKIKRPWQARLHKQWEYHDLTLPPSTSQKKESGKLILTCVPNICRSIASKMCQTFRYTLHDAHTGRHISVNELETFEKYQEYLTSCRQIITRFLTYDVHIVSRFFRKF